jgi:hypothetical protein
MRGSGCMNCDYTIHSVMPHTNAIDVIIKYRCNKCEDIITEIKSPPTVPCSPDVGFWNGDEVTA